MTSEERLRDLLDTLAGRVTMPPGAWEQQQRRQAARRTARRLRFGTSTTLAAAAAVTMVAVAMPAPRTEVTPGATPSPAPPSPYADEFAEPPMPGDAVGREGGSFVILRPGPSQHVDAANATVLAVDSLGGSEYVLARVDSARDCTSTLQQGDFEPYGGLRLGNERPIGEVDGWVTALSMGSDRSALAMIVRLAADAECGAGRSKVVIRNLATGRDRTVYDSPDAVPLAVSLHANGRKVALDVRLRSGERVAITSEITVLDGRTPLNVQQLPGDPGCRLSAPTWRNGEHLVAVRRCDTGYPEIVTVDGRGRSTGTLVAISPVGRPQLQEVTRLDFDESGTRLLISIRDLIPDAGDDNGDRLLWWDGGAGTRLMPVL